ncbi:MAG: hypothetical protein KAH21_02800, partial [Spirochaetaceae bacterium]|nr:hypothetical protein [Spirochaetaceae bacterium]
MFPKRLWRCREFDLSPYGLHAEIMRFMEIFKTSRLFPAVILLFLYAVSFLPAAGSVEEASDDEVIPAKVYVIPLREDVDRYLGVFLGRSLETAKKAGAELVIIEIDTFGGRVDTALEIASRIGSASWARTVAYIPADSGGRGV